MPQYFGTYEDAQGPLPLILDLLGDVIQAQIGDWHFEGRDFSLLETSEPLPPRFVRLNDCLCACRFDFEFEQLLLHVPSKQTERLVFRAQVNLGPPDEARAGALLWERLRLSLGDWQVETDLWEDAFGRYMQTLGPDYVLKNCYGCMYGDYSVYGQSSFGAMYCFREAKSAYRAVQCKFEYLEIEELAVPTQEIALCTQYQVRKKGAGYRG